MARNVPTLPANQYTPNFNVVDTAAGFNQGDIVYFNSGDYGRLANTAVTTANFNVSATLPYTSNTSNSNGGVTTILAASPYTGTFGGTTSSYGVAKLSNGNIVRVGGNTSSYPYFVITDTSNTVVVSPTVVSSSFAMQANGAPISVTALTGGGFVVAWTPSTATAIYYAIYTNTGTVTLSATSDTSFNSGISSQSPAILSLPNGNFVISNNNNVSVFFRIYNSTGTALYAATTWTPATAPAYSTGQVQLAARSDSSFIIHVASQSSLNAFYAIYTATNTQITSGTTVTVATASVYDVCVSTLSDGTTFVLGYQTYLGPNYVTAFKILPTGNVLSSETLQPLVIGNNVSSISTYNTFILGLASGNFVFGCVDAAGYVNYIFYNSSGVAISGITSTNVYWKTAVATSIINKFQKVCAVEYSGNLNLFWSETYGFNSQQSAYCLVSVNQTTYETIPLAQSIIVAVGTQTVPVNGVVQSTQNPISANFLAANTSTSYVTNNLTPSSPTVVISASIDGIALITLNNGNFVYAYRISTTRTVYAAVYSPAGVLQTTITVGVGVNAIAVDCIRAAALTSGKFVISYANGSGTNQSVTSVVYSSAYAVLATIVTTGLTIQYGTSTSTWQNSQNFDIAAITNDRFVLHAMNTGNGYPTWYVYSSAGGSTLATGSTYTGSAPSTMSVVGLPQGGFAVNANISGGPFTYLSAYSNTSGNTFVNTIAINYGSGTAAYSANAVAFQNGSFATIFPNSSAQEQITFWSSGSLSNYQSILINNQYNAASGSACTLGVNAYNEAVLAYNSSAGIISFSTFGIGTSTTALKINNQGSFGSAADLYPVKLSNLYGRVMVIAFFNSSGYPVFATFNTAVSTSQFSTTAGVTQSNATTISTPVAGIAASTATAGTSGVLQTNGNCQVNGNYLSNPSLVQFANGASAGGFGVKGAILGRNVMLLNNV